MKPLNLLALTVVLLAVPAGDDLRAATRDQRTARAPITIRLYNSFGVPVEDLAAARREADAILREAGIDPDWLQCGSLAQQRDERARCELEIGTADIVVRILRSTCLTPSGRRLPLGEALVDVQSHTGSFVTVFADRVASTSERAGASPRIVLARVLAHEIGHLLLGTNRHAAHGLMRPNWTDHELRHAIGLEWHFSISEARRMRAAIITRRVEINDRMDKR